MKTKNILAVFAGLILFVPLIIVFGVKLVCTALLVIVGTLLYILSGVYFIGWVLTKLHQKLGGHEEHENY